jgi:hypothetical protein
LILRSVVAGGGLTVFEVVAVDPRCNFLIPETAARSTFSFAKGTTAHNFLDSAVTATEPALGEVFGVFG